MLVVGAGQQTLQSAQDCRGSEEMVSHAEGMRRPGGRTGARLSETALIQHKRNCDADSRRAGTEPSCLLLLRPGSQRRGRTSLPADTSFL